MCVENFSMFFEVEVMLYVKKFEVFLGDFQRSFSKIFKVLKRCCPLEV
jgi:hypothetical protein